MTLPASGTISLSQVSVELGRAADSPIYMDRLDVRALAQKPTPGTPIAMSDLHNSFCHTFDIQVGLSGGQAGYNSGGPYGNITNSFFLNSVVRAMYFATGGFFIFSIAAFDMDPDSFYGLLIRPGAGTSSIPSLLLRSIDASVTTGTDGLWHVWIYQWSGVGTNRWLTLGSQHVFPQLVRKF